MRAWLSLCLSLMLPVTTPAVTLTLELGSVEWPGIVAEKVAAQLSWDDSNRLQLSLGVDHLRAGGRTFDGLRLDCGEAEWTDEHLACRRGSLVQSGSGSAPIVSNVDVEYRFAGGELHIDGSDARLAGGRAEIRLNGRGGRWHGSMSARGTPLSALLPLAAALGLPAEGYSDVGGSVDIEAEFAVDDGKLSDLVARADGKGLEFNGAAIADAADMHVEARISSESGPLHIAGDAMLTSGAVYFEPGFAVGDYRPGITLDVTGEPVSLHWDGSLDSAAGLLEINQARLVEPGVASLTVSGSVALATSSSAAQPLRVDIVNANVETLYTSHLKPHCVHLPALCGWEFDGGIDVSLVWNGQELTDLALRFTDFYADDDRKRFRIHALNGELTLHSGRDEVTSELRWQSAGWQRLQLGAGSVAMASRDRTLKVTRWSDVDVLGGTFKVDKLELGAVGSRDFSVTVSGVLTPISMQEFSQAMGWPIMSGTLSGVIPGLTYRHGILTLNGDLLVRIFAGNVVVRGLTIENPFGQAPVLSTDIDVRNIDLEQLTGTFAFGKIEGTIEGQVKGLRLENWEPVAFDGYLQTPEDDDRRHRISQKAVDNLSAIGGGITGALSRGFLRIFQDYSYDRLGLHCRLADGVCAMQGVAPAADGFYIVTRGGLLPPWIDVKGSGRRLPDGRFGIAWNDILLGLKRINKGQMKLQ